MPHTGKLALAPIHTVNPSTDEVEWATDEQIEKVSLHTVWWRTLVSISFDLAFHVAL